MDVLRIMCKGVGYYEEDTYMVGSTYIGVILSDSGNGGERYFVRCFE